MEELTQKDPIFNLWLLMTKTRRVIFKRRERELLPYNLTPEQCEILYIVKNLGNEAFTSKIARLMLREVHTISSIVSRMVERGLLTKTKDVKYKNMIRVALTKKGSEAQCQSEERNSIHQILSSLNEEERQQLWDYLKVILDKGIEVLDKSYKSPWSPKK